MNEPMNNNLPLSGIKVIDLTRAIAGPVCSSLLADMGAEVIRVESPDRDNDLANQPLADTAMKLFQRNKKSITLNMRSSKGKDILSRLIQWGDVLIENFKPGVMQEMGLDYSKVKGINPRLVMVSISGYGQTGPYAGRAGLDWVGQAMGGIMSMTGPPESPPILAGAPIADISSGVFAALGAVLALYRCKSTGLGQQVETTLMDSIAYLMGFHIAKYAFGQEIVKGGLITPGSGTFQTMDGHYLVIMGALAQHFPRFAQLIGREDLATAPGYQTRAERMDHAEEINTAIQAWMETQTITVVEAAMEKLGIPFGRVQTIEELLKDPNLIARNRIAEVEVDGEKKRIIGPYPTLSDTPGTIRTPSPRLGKHNNEVYGRILGFSEEELVSLRMDGVI
jgi:crotonobetainyl-CoA:carnitine CoA-transferase CaiB-like acyl-CoA transferase